LINLKWEIHRTSKERENGIPHGSLAGNSPEKRLQT